MTAAIRVSDSEGKAPDHVAGRFGSDARETLAHSTIGRRSPRRCRPSPRSLVECGLLDVIHAPSCTVGSARRHLWRRASISVGLLAVPGSRTSALSQLLSRVDLQLLDIAFHRLTEIGYQAVAICDLN